MYMIEVLATTHSRWQIKKCRKLRLSSFYMEVEESRPKINTANFIKLAVFIAKLYKVCYIAGDERNTGNVEENTGRVWLEPRTACARNWRKLPRF